MRTLLALWLALAAVPALGDGLVDPRDMPGPLKEVGIEQHLGEQLPLDAVFVDERGREVSLGDVFGARPVVMVFVYYECPMLCPMVLNGVAKSLGVLSFDAGQEFDVVVVSIDPAETPEMAAAAKRTTVKRYGRPETAGGWHFLTAPQGEGGAESIRRVTEAAGFRYAFVEESGVTPEGGRRYQFAHASSMIVVTPDGKLAKYLMGIDFPPKDVRLALVEASAGRIGTVVDQILLYCFRYDPKLGKYTAVVTRILRLAGVAFCLGLALFLFIMWRRDALASQRSVSTLGAARR